MANLQKKHDCLFDTGFPTNRTPHSTAINLLLLYVVNALDLEYCISANAKKSDSLLIFREV